MICENCSGEMGYIKPSEIGGKTLNLCWDCFFPAVEEFVIQKFTKTTKTLWDYQ